MFTGAAFYEAPRFNADKQSLSASVSIRDVREFPMLMLRKGEAELNTLNAEYPDAKYYSGAALSGIVFIGE